MDNKLIPQTPTIIPNSTTTHWDLAMDAAHHHPNHLFPFASLPTWQNFSPLPPPFHIIHHHHHPPSPSPSPSPFMGPRATKQMEALAEVEEEKEEGLAPETDKDDGNNEEEEELGEMKEMMYKIAVMQPVEIDPATIQKPKRRNVRISDDPQSVAARLRRERISEKIRILQRLVPGGTKLDTASMLDEAVRYVKFLKRQIRSLQHPPQLPNPLLPPPPPPFSASASTSAAAAAHIGGELPLCFSFNQG